MSQTIQDFIEKLSPRARGAIKGTAKLIIEGEGSVMVDETGARVGDDDADVTLIANAQVFEALFTGDQNMVMAYMSGKLKVEGNAQRALKVGGILTG